MQKMNPAKSIKWTVTFFDWDSTTLRQAFRDTPFYDNVMDSMKPLCDDDSDRCNAFTTVKTSEELSRVLQLAYGAKYRGDVIVNAGIDFDALRVNVNLTSNDRGYIASSATMFIDKDKKATNRRTFKLVTAIEKNLAELRNLAIRT